MTKKQVTPKFGGPKASKPVTAKLPKPESSKFNKPTPALIADSTEVVRPLQPPVSFEENIHLTDLDYKIVDTVVEFNLHRKCSKSQILWRGLSTSIPRNLETVFENSTRIMFYCKN